VVRDSHRSSDQQHDQKSSKVLDYVPDEILIKEINRLSGLIEQRFKERDFMKLKGLSHELCGVVGPSSQFSDIEAVARQLEQSVVDSNMEKMGKLIDELVSLHPQRI